MRLTVLVVLAALAHAFFVHALPRDFAFPILCLAIVAFATGRLALMAAVMLLGAAIYPTAAVTVGMGLALAELMRLARSDASPGPRRASPSRRWPAFSVSRSTSREAAISARASASPRRATWRFSRTMRGRPISSARANWGASVAATAQGTSRPVCLGLSGG
jgi:hypothetical protein